jgi:hypothetical protein
MLLIRISIYLILMAVSRAIDDGFSRLSALQVRSLSSEGRIIRFSTADF